MQKIAGDNRENLRNDATQEFKEIEQPSKPHYSYFLELMATKYGNNWIELAKKLAGKIVRRKTWR